MKTKADPVPAVIFPESFRYSRSRFRVKLLDNVALTPFKGSMLRGLLGTALFQLNCRIHEAYKGCRNCHLVKECAYGNLFKPELVFKNTIATPPFVLNWPEPEEYFRSGDIIEFTLTLFGHYSQYFEYFLEAFAYASRLGMGKARAAYKLIQAIDDLSGKCVYRDGETAHNRTVSQRSLSSLETVKTIVRKVRLDFLTPVRLKQDKRPVYFPDMKGILNAIVRRVHIVSRSIWKDPDFVIERSFLEKFYCDIVSYDLKYDRSFKCRGVGNDVELSGFTGSMECRGNFTRLIGLLRAGEIFHIGTRTSYGLGKLRVTIL